MEALHSQALPEKEPASPSAYLTQLRQQLLERSEGKDFFETRVEDQFYCLTFTNALILSCLTAVTNTFTLRERLSQRLFQEISENGTANYWMRSVAGAQVSPYPDDLDDTFCTLAAIHLHNKQRLSGDILARATLALTATEVEPGGPYRTWLVSPSAPTIWRDIDPVVNANIAYFLQQHDIRLPKLDHYLKEQISLPASPYYPSPIHVLYFLARGLENGQHGQYLVPTLLNCEPANILERAMLISSLLRCQEIHHARHLALSFLEELKAGHGFDELPICVDTITAHEKHFATCAELTAALCLEALSLLVKTDDTLTLTEAALDPSLATIAAVKVVLNHNDDQVLQTLTDSFLTKLTNIPQVRELTTLPLDFAQAWNSQTQTISETTLQRLCVAHLLGWIAYTLYDDIIDGDGTPALLSIANIAARRMQAIFLALDLDDDFQVFFQQTLDDMDRANAQELLHARFPLEKLPSYTDPHSLYSRSGGIFVSPIAVLRLAGYSQTSPEADAVTRFFRHYLSAKQLNDDAHDWQKDLERGHATAVVTKLLERHGKMYSPEDITALQELFWNEVILSVCDEIQKHILEARSALQRIGKIDHPDFFNKLVDPLEASAQKALRERQESLAFLRTFSKQDNPDSSGNT